MKQAIFNVECFRFSNTINKSLPVILFAGCDFFSAYSQSLRGTLPIDASFDEFERWELLEFRVVGDFATQIFFSKKKKYVCIDNTPTRFGASLLQTVHVVEQDREKTKRRRFVQKTRWWEFKGDR